MKTVFITGGGSRFGSFLVTFFLKKGFKVAYTYHNTHKEIDSEDTLSIKCDLTKQSECESLLNVLENWSPIDVLVNNASILYSTPLETLTNDFSSFDEMVNLHLRAPLLLSIKIGLKMKKRGWGRIINMIDHTVTGGRAYKNHTCYHLSKYGLYGLSQSLSLDLAPEVTVNSVTPGIFLPVNNTPESRIEEISRAHPLKQTASSEDIAEDIWHLISSKSKTGSTITSNAGGSIPLHYL